MKKLVGAKRYVEKEFCSLADIAQSVGFDTGTPANRVAEYLEEYAERTHGVTLIDARETAQHLLAKLADARVCQEEWSRYNCNAGDPLFLRECVIDLFGYVEILDHRGKIYGVRFPNGCVVLATAYDEPDLYEGEEARVMWQKYARHIEVLARIGGQIIPYAWPGGHPMIYWHQDESSEVFPLCAGCTEANELDGLAWGTIFEIESGDLYDHDLPCDQCGQQLAAYYEEEEEDS